MRILIGVDGSGAAEVACEFVAGRAWPIGTRVTLLGAVERVVDWTGLAPPSSDGVEAESAALEAILAERAEILRRAGLSVEMMVARGPAAEVLMHRAETRFADLIVVGSRGLGPAASALLGSVSAHLVDHAGCPVLVVRSPSATRMLLATDGTRSSLNVPRVLAVWGNAFRGLPVEVLSVAAREGFITPWASDGEKTDAEIAAHELIADQVADELIELGWHAAATVRSGEPSRQIVDESREWGADLIVTGSRGLGTVKRMLVGSVAHDVLLHARSSVLVIRGQVAAPIARTAGAFAALSTV